MNPYEPLNLRSPGVQLAIDLAAVVGIVALACVISVAVVGAGFILFFLKA